MEVQERTKNQAEKAPEHLQLAVKVEKDWTISWWEQFKIVSKRTFKERSKDYFDKLRLLQAVGVALLLGLLWWKSKIDTEPQLRDQVSVSVFLHQLTTIESKSLSKQLLFADWFIVLHLHILDIIITLWSSIRVPI